MYKRQGNAPPKEEAFSWHLSVDPADSSSTHALLIGKSEDGFWVYDEWRWDARMQGQLEHREQIEKIKEWLDNLNVTLNWAVYDTASPNYGLLLHRILGIRTIGAIKDVEDGIRVTQAWLADGRIKFDERAKWAIMELGTYQWDENAAERGEDKPLKSNDHAMDALRYFVYLRHPRGQKVRRISA